MEIWAFNQNAEREKTLNFKLQSQESNTEILNCDQNSEQEENFRLQTLDFKLQKDFRLQT